jgi:hypothetical protein
MTKPMRATLLAPMETGRDAGVNTAETVMFARPAPVCRSSVERVGRGMQTGFA